MKQKVKKAVIPAAGLGTRFLPVTKSMPKEMLPLVDTPAIHYVVKEALDAGIDDIIIITGRGKRAVEDYFDDSPELVMHLNYRKCWRLQQKRPALNPRGASVFQGVHPPRRSTAYGLNSVE